MKKIIISIFLTLFFASCTTEEKVTETPVDYSTLKIQPGQDSLFLNANNESRQFSLIGAIINTTEKTFSNSGAITQIDFTVRTIDTVFQTVNTSKAQWLSSNTSVATVSNGLVIAQNPGYTQITAVIGKTSSSPMVVNVRPVNTAPGLYLDPPDGILIFQNNTRVSGGVQQSARLTISEPNSGLNDSTIQYNADGKFNVQVNNLKQGLQTITVRAAHPTIPSLVTARSKVVIYWAPNSIGANAIVGNWLGTTLGKNFVFKIENSIIPTRYDITGKMDIQFAGVGLVRDIDLVGVLNYDGTIEATLTKSYEGFNIAGTFTGYFKSTGTGQGTYSARSEKSGWPTIAFNDVWTAVKVP